MEEMIKNKIHQEMIQMKGREESWGQSVNFRQKMAMANPTPSDIRLCPTNTSHKHPDSRIIKHLWIFALVLPFLICCSPSAVCKSLFANTFCLSCSLEMNLSNVWILSIFLMQFPLLRGSRSEEPIEKGECCSNSSTRRRQEFLFFQSLYSSMQFRRSVKYSFSLKCWVSSVNSFNSWQFWSKLSSCLLLGTVSRTLSSWSSRRQLMPCSYLLTLILLLKKYSEDTSSMWQIWARDLYSHHLASRIDQDSGSSQQLTRPLETVRRDLRRVGFVPTKRKWGVSFIRNRDSEGAGSRKAERPEREGR